MGDVKPTFTLPPQANIFQFRTYPAFYCQPPSFFFPTGELIVRASKAPAVFMKLSAHTYPMPHKIATP